MRENKKNYPFLPALLITIAICIWTDPVRAADDHLIISEILIGGASADEEFVELYNPTPVDIDLKSLPLKLHTVSSSGTTDTSKTLVYTSSNSVIRSNEYFLLASPAYKNSHSEVSIGITYSPSLVSGGALYISASATKNTDVIDLACWGKSTKCDFPLPDPKSGYSLERIANGSDWQESCAEGGTPAKESEECQTEPPLPAESKPSENTSAAINGNNHSSEKISLNEIFSNPKNESDEEYIELKNGGDEPVDLYRWTIRDASKTGKYVFSDHETIEPGKYLAIYKSESKLSLNNANESVYIYDPQNNLVSSVSYEKSQKGASYNFNGTDWIWSKFTTPGAKNKFDSKPRVKIEKPKKVFKNIPADFSASAKDKETKKLKYVWDFGDDKKSYQKKATHKFSKTGKYTVKLSITDESQTIEESFTVNVKNSPRPDLAIVKIIPNPTGKDSKGEQIDIKNNSNKNVDLAGWKIATGSSEKMYNHPVSGEFVINSNETQTITREFSKFSLGNKSGKIALVMPDGKTVDKLEYSKEKIEEDEAYAKVDGKWQWILSNNNAGENLASSQNETEFVEDPTGEIESAENNIDEDAAGEVLGASDESTSDNFFPVQNALSLENAFIFFTRIGFLKTPNEEANYCPLKTPTASLDYLLISSL